MMMFKVLSGDWPEGELGSRFDAGAAPATVAKLEFRRETTGQIAWEGVGTVPQGQLRSPETSLEHLELD